MDESAISNIKAARRKVAHRSADARQESDQRANFKPVAPTQKGNERIAELLNVSCKMLMQDGLANLTLRNVARTAGMRLFNIQHYFPTQADLLRAAIVETITGFERAEAAHLGQMDLDSPQTAFMEACRYYLRLNRRSAVRQLFFDLGALAQRDEVVAAILQDAYAPYHARFRALIQQLNSSLPEAEVARRVDFITAAIEGTMYVLEVREKLAASDVAAEADFLKRLLQIAKS